MTPRRPEDDPEFNAWARAVLGSAVAAQAQQPPRPALVPHVGWVTMTYAHRGCCPRSGQVTFRQWPTLPDGTVSPVPVLCAANPDHTELVRVG